MSCCHLPGVRCLLHSVPLTPYAPTHPTIRAGSRGPNTSSLGLPKDPTSSASPPSPHRGLERGRDTQDPGLQLRALSPRRGPSKPILHAGSLSLPTLPAHSISRALGELTQPWEALSKEETSPVVSRHLEVMNSWEPYWKAHPRTAWGLTWWGRARASWKSIL